MSQPAAMSTPPPAVNGSGSAASVFSQSRSGTWNGELTPLHNRLEESLGSSSLQNSSSGGAYLLPSSPSSKSRRGSGDGYRPTVKKSTGQIPACLVNASVTHCGNNQIYAFGGFDQYTDEVYNHVLRLDLNTLKWDLVDNFGDIPGVRMGHTASLYQGNKLVVFGGENEHREYLSDVVILDLETSRWTSPEVRGPVPRGRARHASVIYEDKLFVIGGITGDTNCILDDLCYLDLKTWTWSRTWSFVARFDHAAWVWGGRLWVFGGLGTDMERGTDLWWLDLKGCPALGITPSSSEGTVEPPRTLNTIAHGPGSPFRTPSSSSQPAGRPGSYTANSASVQVRTLNRRKPTAPGAISSLKFHSGPHVPALVSGTHFHVHTSGLLLDLVTPSETVKPWECNLASLELDSLRWQRMADGHEIFKSGYRWHYCTMNEDGTKAWLLGCNLDVANNGPGAGDENDLSEVLTLDLAKYGLLGNDLMFEVTEHSRILASERQPSPQWSGLGAELAAMFDQPPERGSGTDFVITAECDDNVEEGGHERDGENTLMRDDHAASTPSKNTPTFLPPDAATSAPIHVHRIILQARWPHFKRLYAAQMAEFHTKRMHIPEPYSVVRAFLYYLYTDSIAPHPQHGPDVFEVAGMLVMANLYDMPKLRLLCVNRLSRELDIENAAIVWERAVRTNEGWLKRRASAFCLANWGRIVRTDGFRTLSKQSMLDLCEVVDTEGRVIPGPELEMVGAMGNERLDLASDNKRYRMTISSGAGGEEADEIEGEDEDGMELS